MWISIHAQSMDESINYMVDGEKTVVINLARLRSLERLWHVCTSSVVAVNLYYRSKKRFVYCAATDAGASVSADRRSASVLSRYGYCCITNTSDIARIPIFTYKIISTLWSCSTAMGVHKFIGIYLLQRGSRKAFWTIQVHLLCSALSVPAYNYICWFITVSEYTNSKHNELEVWLLLTSLTLNGRTEECFFFCSN